MKVLDMIVFWREEKYSSFHWREVKFMDPLAEFGDNHTHTHTHIHTHTHTPLVYTCTVPGAHTRCIISFLKQNTILGVEVSCLLR